jgi:hypothetical protein
MDPAALTIRQRYRASIVVWFSVGIAIGALAAAVSPWFLAMLLAFQIAVGAYCMNLRCPRCSHPVLRGGPKDFWTWKAWVPRSCVSCGGQLP